MWKNILGLLRSKGSGEIGSAEIYNLNPKYKVDTPLMSVTQYKILTFLRKLHKRLHRKYDSSWSDDQSHCLNSLLSEYEYTYPYVSEEARQLFPLSDDIYAHLAYVAYRLMQMFDIEYEIPEHIQERLDKLENMGESKVDEVNALFAQYDDNILRFTFKYDPQFPKRIPSFEHCHRFLSGEALTIFKKLCKHLGLKTISVEYI